ncbi:unnamed protein product [Boreogadus saida]
MSIVAEQFGFWTSRTVRYSTQQDCGVLDQQDWEELAAPGHKADRTTTPGATSGPAPASCLSRGDPHPSINTQQAQQAHPAFLHPPSPWQQPC